MDDRWASVRASTEQDIAAAEYHESGDGELRGERAAKPAPSRASGESRDARERAAKSRRGG
jgi:hypothetical protein